MLRHGSRHSARVALHALTNPRLYRFVSGAPSISRSHDRAAEFATASWRGLLSDERNHPFASRPRMPDSFGGSDGSGTFMPGGTRSEWVVEQYTWVEPHARDVVV